MANAGRSSQRATGRRACRASRVRVTQRAALRAVLGGHRAAVRLRDRAHDRKAQAGALVDGVPAAVERLERTASELGGSKPGAGVVDLDRDRLAADGRGRRASSPPGRRVPERRCRSGCRAPAGAASASSCTIASGAVGLQRDAGSVGRRGRTRRRLSLDQPRAITGGRCVGICPPFAHARAPAGPRRCGTRWSASTDAPTERAVSSSSGERGACEREVEFGLEHRERRPQLVTRIVHEPTLSFGGGLQAVEARRQRAPPAERASSSPGGTCNRRLGFGHGDGRRLGTHRVPPDAGPPRRGTTLFSDGYHAGGHDLLSRAARISLRAAASRRVDLAARRRPRHSAVPPRRSEAG